MVNEKRVNELLEVVLNNEKIIQISKINGKDSDKFKEAVEYNARLILEHSNVSNIRDEDIIRLTLDLMISVNNAERKHYTPINKEYLILMCPELNTRAEFRFTRNGSMFKSIIDDFVADHKNTDRIMNTLRPLINDTKKRKEVDAGTPIGLIKSLVEEDLALSRDLSEAMGEFSNKSSAIEDVEIKVEKELYNFMVEYIYDRLPNSTKSDNKEQSVISLYEMTKE